MEKIRKWMTIMAVIGTVLVTALFCYMPVREIIKESKKISISLKQEKTIGNPEDVVKEAASIADTGRELSFVRFEISSDSEKVQTTIWQSKEGICYVFLPGFAKQEKVQIAKIEDKGYFTLGKQNFYEKDEFFDIAYEEAYEFTFYDKNGKTVLSAPLIFLYSSDLPVLMLSTKSESMEAIDAQKGVEEAGEIKLFDENGVLLYQGEADSISGRGNSTFGLVKKPYQFQLKEGADLFGFGKAKEWNLLADGYDETKLRNQIVFGLARELEMEYTPEGVSVDVYCNGVYYGVYFLCEKVQVGEERVEIADMEEYTNAVYSKQELQNLESVENDDGSLRWTTSEVEAEDISGGYLLERELEQRYHEEKSGFITDQGDVYALQSPKYATREQVNYIADYMQEFQDALWEEDGVNKEKGKHYSEYIDMDSFVKKYLIEEITRNYDGGVTSSFFYKASDAEGGKLYAGPVWDYDVSFGNCNLDKIVSNPVGISKLNDHIYGTEVFARLYEKEEFFERVVSLYEQKALPYLNTLLEGGIDALADQMAQAVKLDSIRWEALENRYQYYEEYENSIRYLKYYIDARKEFLSEVWLEGAVYHCITFMVDGEAFKKIYVKDGETAGLEPIPSRYSSIFLGWISEKRGVPYDEYKPVYEDMTFCATWQELSEEEVVIVSEQAE